MTDNCPKCGAAPLPSHPYRDGKSTSCRIRELEQEVERLKEQNKCLHANIASMSTYEDHAKRVEGEAEELRKEVSKWQGLAQELALKAKEAP